jgi:hypothetical protein
MPGLQLALPPGGERAAWPLALRCSWAPTVSITRGTLQYRCCGRRRAGIDADRPAAHLSTGCAIRSATELANADVSLHPDEAARHESMVTYAATSLRPRCRDPHCRSPKQALPPVRARAISGGPMAASAVAMVRRWVTLSMPLAR